VRRAWLAALVAFAALAASGRADDAAPAPKAVPQSVPQLGGNSLQIAAYLGGMLVLFIGGAWLLRNGLPSMQRGKGERKLDISETRGLGSRQFLVVAQYENRKVLLGVCPGRIDYLCSLSAAEPEFPKLPTEKPE
jgi:flagellar protein FliO/FliZ